MSQLLSLSMFRALFETAPDAMIVIDRSGHIVLANPQAARLFGYAGEALVGCAVESLMPEEVRLAHQHHRNRYVSNPRVRPMGAGQELTGLRRDGERFPVEIALSPIQTDESGYFVASIRDISETQRARQALIRARYDVFVAQVGQLALEAPLEVTLDRAPVLVANALGDYAVLIVFGHGPRRELQVRAEHGAAPQELDALLDALAAAQALAQETPRGEPVRLDFSAAGSAFLNGVALPLFDLDRSMGAVVVVSRSAPEIDRVGLYFLQSVANVLAAAVQRNRAQEQLAHAHRLEAVGQLTGGIAHDFNNLLTVISGNLQLLEAELNDRDETRELIASALRAVGHGAELTRKLLAFARRQRLHPRAVAAQPLLTEIGLMLRRTLGEQVEVEMDCPPGVPQVFADPGQLDAALVNLALNARDAMPHGGRLCIAVQQQRISAADAQGEARPGEYLVFSVADTGLGMTPEVLSRAFEPFFTTKEPGKGSGLGLSMVYGFVTQSGGHLQVDSRLGHGTRIEMFLPVAPSTSAAAALPKIASPARGHEVVLVVEDEPDVRGIALAFLRSLGYTVHAAANAREALAVLAAHAEIAVLFSDVVLGAGATGGELAREARRLRPDLAVLLTSGYEPPAPGSAAQSGSEFELLRKPYRREDLAAAIRRALDNAL